MIKEFFDKLNKPAEKPYITNEQAEELWKESAKYHCEVYRKQNGNYYNQISNALACLYYNGGLFKGHRERAHSFYREEYLNVQKKLFKLRRYYELSKTKRKDLHSKVLKLEAEIARLKSGKKSRLEKIGELIEKLPNMTSLLKGNDGIWAIGESRFLSKDILQVLKRINNG